MYRPRATRKALLLLLVVWATSTHAHAAEFTGRVVKVADGDSITVLIGKQQERVRLLSIDCPENKQPFSSKAKALTSDMCFGKHVVVTWETRDRYGRVLGEVLVDGKSVNRALLEAGMAWHYREYSKDPKLQKLEDDARAAKLGLWADKEPIAPWEWRKTERERRKVKAPRSLAG